MSCGTIFAGRTDTPPQRTVYAPAGAGYRIAFPGQPELLGGLGAAIFKRGEHSFVVSHADIPLGKPTGIEALRETSLELVAMGKGELAIRVERDLRVGGLPAKEFVIDFSKTGGIRLSRHVLMGVRIISAVYLGPRGSEKSVEAQHFLDSLEIVK